MKKKIKIWTWSIVYAFIALVAIFIWIIHTDDMIVIQKWVGTETPDLASEHENALPSNETTELTALMVELQEAKDTMRSEPARLQKINYVVLAIMIAITIIFFIWIQKIQGPRPDDLQPEFSHRKAGMSSPVDAGIPINKYHN